MSENKYVPFSVLPTSEDVLSSDSQAVGIKPEVESVNRKRSYPIVIVPGVMGSRLWTKDDGKDVQVWPQSVGNPFREGDQDLNRLGDLDIFNSKEIFAIEPENQQEITNREYGTVDVYKKLVDGLCDKFVSNDVYLFSYDWRLDNRETAKKLMSFITEKKFDKVELVCHSMGGLVAYYFNQLPKGKDLINKLITLGTPYEGSVNLLRAILTGEPSGTFADNIFKWGD